MYAAQSSASAIMLPVPPEHQPRQRFWKIVAQRAVLAAGAHERPIVFGNNDRPGVMLAARRAATSTAIAVAPGRRIAVFTNNDDGWRSGRPDAHAAGSSRGGHRLARGAAGRMRSSAASG